MKRTLVLRHSSLLIFLITHGFHFLPEQLVPLQELIGAQVEQIRVADDLFQQSPWVIWGIRVAPDAILYGFRYGRFDPRSGQEVLSHDGAFFFMARRAAIDVAQVVKPGGYVHDEELFLFQLVMIADQAGCLDDLFSMLRL